MIRDAAEAVIKAILAEKDYLNDLDEKIGDGDHGSKMADGARAIKEALDATGDASLKKFLQATGDAVIMNVGGTAGPLYGAALLEAAKVVNKNSKLDAATLEKIFSAAVEGIQKRGNAKLGEKTMLDVLIPIRDTFNAENCAGKELEEILTEARGAARDGLEFTKTIVAKKGRAASIKEKSIGFEDAGAASVAIIFRVLCGFWKDHLIS